ncbi:interactor of HORMAD1 protein 1 isoform X2 [Labrus bergylta]|uniref:Coiled-coil domain containing 36 n=1 Tax=Labrus bergylta TaxID=56723 RepID=A0A3Q3MY46_9LABR|nr:interactor of HORMAD1 protein 1 isoform X2 [Labrus bergylta]
MSHIRKIKEMLNIQPASRNMATSGYSNLTDSQLFFGSQFWPENSQGASQDMSLSSRTSQQSSQEGSDPKFSCSYHTRPLLLGDLKDKSKAFGLLEKFEDDKKKAKEKYDSDHLTKEFHHIRETLSNLVSGTEKNTAVCQNTLGRFDNFASTLQNSLSSLQSNILQQFETLLDKVNSQREITTDLEEKVQKSGENTAELGSNLQSLRKSLECLREKQERERNMLEEALKLLSTLVSEHSAKPKPEEVVHSAIQTSPGPEQQMSNILLDNKLEATQLTCISNNLEHNQNNVLPQNSSCIVGKRKLTTRDRRRCKKRPLVLSQRSKHTVRDENSRPLMNCNKQKNVSLPLGERHDVNAVKNQVGLNTGCHELLNRETRSKTAGCVITPLSCWSQDSSSSLCPAGFEPILLKLSAESRSVTPEKPEGFWQLFDMDSAL